MIPVIGCGRIVVFGLGIVGKSVLEAVINTPGVTAFACDDNPSVVADARMEHERIIFCPMEEIDWNGVDTLVLSPGVPLNYPEPHAVVSAARACGCTIITDIELLWRFVSGYSKKIVGITGTNGKSTTTKLVYDILRNAGFNVQLGGNIGIPVMLCDPGADIYVLEISSYQLDLLKETVFDYSVLLNITPDHLDRYMNMDEYARSKLRIFSNSDVRVLSVDSAVTRDFYDSMSEEVIPVSSRKQLDKGVCMSDGMLFTMRSYLDIKNRKVLLGKHNEENICAATAVTLAMNVPEHIIRDTVINFVPLEHRTEIVGEFRDIMFINDSKATTPESTEYAIRSYNNKRILLILGGKVKYPNCLKAIEEALRLVSGIYLIGASTEEFATYLHDNGMLFFKRCETLENAIHEAYRDATESNGNDEGTVILLSPACASFDQWKNFEERGKFFAKIANDIISRKVLG